MKRDLLDYLGTVIGELELPDDTPESVWQEHLAKFAEAPTIPTQYQKDTSRYLKRAEAKATIISKMAADNVTRLRNGTWNTTQLISLVEDPELMKLLSKIESLSFELAIGSIPYLTNPLLTAEIKAEWIKDLSQYLYLNG